MKKFFHLSILCFLLSSCSSMNTFTLWVTNPAPVGIPSSVKKIGVIDCSQNKPESGNGRIIAFNAKELKSEGIQAELNGLQSELIQARRFDSIKQLSDMVKDSAGADVNIEQLDWDKMEKMCELNNVDILFVLETYEIDSRLNISAGIGFGHGAGYVETGGNMNTLLLSGWRIYDPQAKLVVDEFNYSQAFNFGASDIDPLSAVIGVISNNEAVKSMSSKAGRAYAKRVIPTKAEVYRDYFIRGSDSLKRAKHFVDRGDWASASNVWQKETNNPNPVIAGRACYNLAVANEVNKRYDLAIDWANQAFDKLHNYKTSEYIEILKDRREKENILKELESK